MWMFCGHLLSAAPRGLDPEFLGERWEFTVQGDLYHPASPGQISPAGLGGTLTYRMLRLKSLRTAWGPRDGVLQPARMLGGAGAPDTLTRSGMDADLFAAPGVAASGATAVAAVALWFPGTAECVLAAVQTTAEQHDRVLHDLLAWTERTYQLIPNWSPGRPARRRAPANSGY